MVQRLVHSKKRELTGELDSAGTTKNARPNLLPSFKTPFGSCKKMVPGELPQEEKTTM